MADVISTILLIQDFSVCFYQPPCSVYCDDCKGKTLWGSSTLLILILGLKLKFRCNCNSPNGAVEYPYTLSNLDSFYGELYLGFLFI